MKNATLVVAFLLVDVMESRGNEKKDADFYQRPTWQKNYLRRRNKLPNPPSRKIVRINHHQDKDKTPNSLQITKIIVNIYTSFIITTSFL